MNKVTETLKNRKLQFVYSYKIYFEELKKLLLKKLQAQYITKLLLHNKYSFSNLQPYEKKVKTECNKSIFLKICCCEDWHQKQQYSKYPIKHQPK